MFLWCIQCFCCASIVCCDTKSTFMYLTSIHDIRSLYNTQKKRPIIDLQKLKAIVYKHNNTKVCLSKEFEKSN